jgi:phosphoethanolamine N-methyltransferase
MKIRTTLSVCLFALLSQLSLDVSAEPFATLEEEYTPNYCLQLEAAYGDGMMSEGGAAGIDLMFDQIALEGKSALDIGCGLGGVVFYLAEKYGMEITGLEVNPWMVQEAKRRISEPLNGKVDFLLSTSNSNWPIPNESCDLIYSKGVLTHLETKDEVFQESHRLLKSGGLLVITDWLSADEKKWGENIARLVELENLVLFPESVAGYIETLEKNGFTVLSVRNDSSAYLKFNQEIVGRLADPARHTVLLNYFSDSEREASILGYSSIAEALKAGELKVMRFVAQKK